ncbi:mononuclear molybdenum enzyme YedY, partial [Campylobacter jejuni]|nr:mononuclear molybdenum enzyme YedY [Campylobacter jejuni]
GDFFTKPTLMFNGYEKEVASLYKNMDLKVNF